MAVPRRIRSGTNLLHETAPAFDGGSSRSSGSRKGDGGRNDGGGGSGGTGGTGDGDGDGDNNSGDAAVGGGGRASGGGRTSGGGGGGNSSSSPNVKSACAAASQPTSPSPLSRTGAHAKSQGGHTLTALDRRNYQRNKLMQIFGDTQEQRLDTSLNQILLDGETPEGRTIAHYLRGFSTVEKNPATAASSVRQFIDGMRQYVTESRGPELIKLVVHHAGIADSEESPEETLQDHIERALQLAIVSPIHDRLVKCIQSQVREQDQLFEQRRKLVMGKPQAVFGIPHAHASRTRWAGAMLELSSLERARTPALKMDVLLRTAKAIYKTYVAEHAAQGDAARFLAGDDFLPIFIYVICNSHASRLEMTAEYLYSLSNQGHLSGEGGYYLTVFSSSLMFLKTHEWSQEELGARDNLPRMNSGRGGGGMASAGGGSIFATMG
jgi:hypothetical protein